MNFFDSIIGDFTAEIKNKPSERFCPDEKKLWGENDHSCVILQRDTAFELEGMGFNMVTSAAVDDEIIVVGDELRSISADRKFARVCVVQLDDLEDEQKLYNAIRKIDYIKYHFFPEGYMIRTSSRAHKEAVRVSSSALKRGISFEKLGNLLIEKYKEQPFVKGVRVCFVTEPRTDFCKIESIALKNHAITETLNHIINNISFDCDTCNLKPICDEVEGMKELHFKSSKRGM